MEAINLHLHRMLSIGRQRLPGRALAVGDPVVFIKNDYARDLQNGSLGTMVDFVAPGGVIVDFDGRRLSMAGSDIDNLSLAYGLTVHKAQGSQFKRVVMPVFSSRVLDRSLVYTAITRATEQIVLIGDRMVLAKAVAAPLASDQRETALQMMLQETL